MEGKKTIVVGVTASIAAYKVLDIVKKLKKQGYDVHVIMTEHATALVDAKEFEKVSGNPVHRELFDPDVDFKAYLAQDRQMKHISLADEADLILICPATANILAKIANGFADDLLSTTLLATAAPVIFAPAMNVKMWKHPATQENVEKLKKLDYVFIDPEYGDLACGYKGVGRLAGGNHILEVVNDLLRKSDELVGKKVIVTSGATQEPIDAVRVITNRASGKMGAAIADEAFIRGAEVVLIRGRNSVSGRYHYKEIEAETADEMLTAIKKEIKHADIFFHTAAVSDFTVKNPPKKKMKSDMPWSLSLEPRLKILGQLKKLNPKIFLVGFKAEVNLTKKKLVDIAYVLLKKSNADLVVANDIGKKHRGFAVDTNEVHVIDKSRKVTHFPLASKSKIARQLIDYVCSIDLDH